MRSLISANCECATRCWFVNFLWNSVVASHFWTRNGSQTSVLIGNRQVPTPAHLPLELFLLGRMPQEEMHFGLPSVPSPSLVLDTASRTKCGKDLVRKLSQYPECVTIQTTTRRLNLKACTEHKYQQHCSQNSALSKQDQIVRVGSVTARPPAFSCHISVTQREAVVQSNDTTWKCGAEDTGLEG